MDVPFIYEETELSPVTAAVTAESEEVLPLLLKRLQEETSPYDWKKAELRMDVRRSVQEACVSG